MNNGTDNQKVLGNCPSCHGLMQIPVVTDVASIAKCPHCQNKTSVRDLLASVVPEAEIVREDAVKATDYVVDRQRVYDQGPKSREKFDVPNQLYNGARRRRSKKGKSKRSTAQGRSSRSASSNGRPEENRRSESTEASANGRDSNGRDSNGDRSNSPSINGRSQPTSRTAGKSVTRATASTASSVATQTPNLSQRPKSPNRQRPPRPPARTKRRSSEMEDDEPDFGVVEVLKFLLGGLIAAPLAYLALLWVLGVDPFGMATTFESVSPSLIPSSLHSDASEGAERPGGYASSDNDSSSTNVFESKPSDAEGLPLPSLDPDMVR